MMGTAEQNTLVRSIVSSMENDVEWAKTEDALVDSIDFDKVGIKELDMIYNGPPSARASKLFSAYVEYLRNAETKKSDLEEEIGDPENENLADILSEEVGFTDQAEHMGGQRDERGAPLYARLARSEQYRALYRYAACVAQGQAHLSAQDESLRLCCLDRIRRRGREGRQRPLPPSRTGSGTKRFFSREKW